jgi:hypothetical protein
MSFQVRYGKNGELIQDESLKQQLEAAVQQPEIQEQPEQEVAQEYSEPEQHIEEIEEEVVQPAKSVKTNSDREENLRYLREAKERAEKEREEAIRYAMQLKSQYEQPKQQESEEEDDIQIGQDDLAEGKHLKSLNKKYKDLKKELNSYKQLTAQQQQEHQLALTEAKLRSKYPDLDSVISGENLDKLKNQYPEVFHTISSTQDVYSKGVAAYTMIKNLGINKEESYLSEKAKAQINSAKPKPMNSIAPQRGTSPLSQANAFENGLTESLKQKLIQEMRDAAKNL